MKRKIVIVAAVLVLISLSLLMMNLFIGMKKTLPKDVNRKTIPYVKVTPVDYVTLLSPIEERGRLLSNMEVTISSEVSGLIVESGLPMKVGQNFKKGDLLVKIYDADFSMELKARKSNFLNSLASTLPDIKVDYPNRFEVWMDFFKSVSLESDLPELPIIESVQEKIFLSSRNILGEYFGIQSAEERLRKYNIYAPFDGTYVEVYMQVGAVANPGTRVAKIIESNNLELHVPVESRDIGWLRIGDAVDVLSENGERICTGRLVRKAGFVDSGTQSISVFVKIDSNCGVPLYQGQYLTARFSGKKLFRVMEIPRNSVFRNNRVYVVEEGKLRVNEIQVVKINDNTLVFRGLKEGALLVTEPLVKATEHMKVEILE